MQSYVFHMNITKNQKVYIFLRCMRFCKLNLYYRFIILKNKTFLENDELKFGCYGILQFSWKVCCDKDNFQREHNINLI